MPHETQTKIAEKIRKKLNCTVSRLKIFDVLYYIRTEITNTLMNNLDFSVKNFGTFYVITAQSRGQSNLMVCNDIECTDEMELVLVKFIPHKNFIQMAKYRFNNFPENYNE